MEFFISSTALKNMLADMQGIVEKKNSIPVLSNIVIESVGERAVRITGTDLDVTLRCELEAEIKQAGSICVQARKLFDIVRLLPDSQAHFAKDDNQWVKIKSGRSNFRMAGVSREQFPETPTFRNSSLKIAASILKSFIKNTVHAITQEQSRFTLSGAKFMIERGTARMVTTDGHRLAFEEITGIEALSKVNVDVLIPKKALTELTKIARDFDGDIGFGEDDNHLYFEVGDKLLVTRKLSGNFPNYDMVIPRDNDRTVSFDPKQMRDCLQRVALMADERTHSVKFVIRAGEIVISSQASEEGSAEESIAAEYTGADEVAMGFNSLYVQDFLNLVAKTDEDDENAPKDKTGRAVLEFKDAGGQTLFRPVQSANRNSFNIVMPLRI